MPEIRHYTVTQTRVLKVAANSPDGAARIAASVFRGGDGRMEGVWGHATEPVREVCLDAKEEGR